MDGFLAALTVVAALGCGLNAGVFFAFSSFVMKALARLQPAQGIAAMQSINLVAITGPMAKIAAIAREVATTRPARLTTRSRG
jgi:uncharacterized membrane protein